MRNSIALTTRLADLDSLRHVNNRVYEQFCAEGRYQLLAANGYGLEALLAQAITLRPVATFVKFALQQRAGATLNIQTEAFSTGQGGILWNHQLTQPDGQVACQVQAQTATHDREGKPVELLPATTEAPPPRLIETVPSFSGRCARSTSTAEVNYTEMDVFGALPIAAWWRIFEEGRHKFGERLDLTLARLVALDTHIFWVAGTYQYDQPLRAGQALTIHTWLEKIVRIRAYIRQEIWTADGTVRLGASREEHLIVALSQTRPKAMPPEMAGIMQPYVEYPA